MRESKKEETQHSAGENSFSYSKSKQCINELDNQIENLEEQIRMLYDEKSELEMRIRRETNFNKEKNAQVELTQSKNRLNSNSGFCFVTCLKSFSSMILLKAK
jgi:septation ring formation regulator EzrA